MTNRLAASLARRWPRQWRAATSSFTAAGPGAGRLRRLGADGASATEFGSHDSGLVTDNAARKARWTGSCGGRYDYRLRYDPRTGMAEATVTVTLTNDAPPSGLPDYVLGGRVVPLGFSRQITQIYTPLTSSPPR